MDVSFYVCAHFLDVISDLLFIVAICLGKIFGRLLLAPARIKGIFRVCVFV